MSFLDYLKQFEDEFKNAEVNTDEFGNIPDGKYRVRVDRVELKESKAGRPQLVWEFVIAEGQYEGWRLWKYNGLDSADKIGWLKNDLHKAGLKLEKLTDLGESLEHLLDRALEVNVKTKGEYQNVYINKEISLEPSTNMAPIDINDEDLPF